MTLDSTAVTTGRLGRMAGPWNANIHYDARLTACVPGAARVVLDVGCGDGFLAARLAPRVPHVVAIDIDAAVYAQTTFQPSAPIFDYGVVFPGNVVAGR